MRARRPCDALGHRDLWVKNDAVSHPTLSFKDRVVAVALSKAKELGFDTVACASTGNLGNSTAANAAQAGSVQAARQAFVDRQPMGRLGSPEEIAALAVYLASDAAQFITGQAVVIDGGLTL